MGSFSEKVYLQLKMPTEEMAVSDHRRVELALNTLGEHGTNPILPADAIAPWISRKM